MTDRSAALDMDRLPWLSDERAPKPRNRERMPLLLVAALLGAVVLAAASYWLGTRSVDDGEVVTGSTVQAPPAATVTLPEVSREPTAPSVQLVPMPEVEPVLQPPPVRLEGAHARRPVKKLRALPRSEPKPVTITKAEAGTEA